MDFWFGDAWVEKRGNVDAAWGCLRFFCLCEVYLMPAGLQLLGAPNVVCVSNYGTCVNMPNSCILEDIRGHRASSP